MIVVRCVVRQKHRLRSFKEDHISTPLRSSSRLELLTVTLCSLVLCASPLKCMKAGFFGEWHGGQGGYIIKYKVSYT